MICEPVGQREVPLEDAVNAANNVRHDRCWRVIDSAFLAKLGIVLEETDESAHWLELIIADNMLPRPRVEPLRIEADELCAIFYSAITTSRGKS